MLTWRLVKERRKSYTGDERTLIGEIEALGMKEIVVRERLHITLNEWMAKRDIVLSMENGEGEVGTRSEQPHIPEELNEACEILVSYLKRTQKSSLEHLQPFEYIQKSGKVIHRCQFDAQS